MVVDKGCFKITQSILPTALLQHHTNRNSSCADDVHRVSTKRCSLFGVWLDTLTMLCQFYTAFIGYQFGRDLSSRPLSLCANVSTEFLWHISASQWKVTSMVYSLLDLDTSGYHKYRRQHDRKVLLFLGHQYGAACQQPCITALC